MSSSLAESEAQAKAKAAHSAMVLSTLENENHRLKQQLEEQRCSYEEKVTEVKLNAEEEAKTRNRVHEAAVSVFITLLCIL